MTTKGPCIATCKRHHGGTKERYVHPPMNPVTRTLPSPFSAQLAPCVIIPRTVKTMRAHAYTTTYEVRECHGSYNGIDSAYVGEYGNLNLRSPLHDTNLLLSLHHRQDVQGVLRRMVNKEVIDQACADDRINGGAVMCDTDGCFLLNYNIFTISIEFQLPLRCMERHQFHLLIPLSWNPFLRNQCHARTLIVSAHQHRIEMICIIVPS